jgi:mannitol-specific phosphotransferase system IIBC component
MMNFVHGSAGVIPVLVLGAEIFPDLYSRLMKASERLGDKTWHEGFLLMGNGISQGITGNGYALHSLYRKYQ